MPLAATSTWMDLEIIIVSEVSQTKKEKYHTLSLIIWKLKKKKKRYKLIYKQKETHRRRKEAYGYQTGEGRGGIN